MRLSWYRLSIDTIVVLSDGAANVHALPFRRRSGRLSGEKWHSCTRSLVKAHVVFTTAAAAESCRTACGRLLLQVAAGSPLMGARVCMHGLKVCIVGFRLIRSHHISHFSRVAHGA